MVKCYVEGCVIYPAQCPVLYRVSPRYEMGVFMCDEHFVEEFGSYPKAETLGEEPFIKKDWVLEEKDE